MKKGLTKIVFVVDRSGSMESIASDMIGGFNQFIKKQKETDVGECRVSFNQFDDIFEEVYKNVLLVDVKELTSETYVPRNSTALYDAIGRTINSIGEELAALPEDQRPEKVIVVIITDGEENASQEFTSKIVSEKITHQTETYNWQFLYLGANQNAWDVGRGLGIKGTHTSNYVSRGSNSTGSAAVMWTQLSGKIGKVRAMDAQYAADAMTYTPEEQKLQNDLVKSNTP